MNMANGTQAQGSKITFKKRSLVHQQQPDLPVGKWEVVIPTGRCKPTQTAAEKGGDPGVLIPLKVEKADNEEHETFKGAFVTLRLYFYDGADPEKRKGANANLRTAMSLAEACDLELKDIYPDEIGDEDDIWDIIKKIEGKRFPIWTTHRPSEFNGEKIINVDIRFKEPGSGLATRKDDDEEEDTKKTARGGRGKGRR